MACGLVLLLGTFYLFYNDVSVCLTGFGSGQCYIVLYLEFRRDARGGDSFLLLRGVIKGVRSLTHGICL